ncbi:hypothetical protein KAR91_51905 [Candidatus Pacearchaeota archaeon]|nr:hypothetical protein [Candidatus Pacearchaeota archaeon]
MPKENERPDHIEGIRVRRERITSLKFEPADIEARIRRFADEWEEARSGERHARLQRYAKYRQWTEGSDWPWPDSSDAKIPDMTTQSMRVQDTLHNSVMSARPPVTARALDKSSDSKAETVDKVLDHQLFIDMEGENFIGDASEAFSNDGVFTVFVPWITERRPISDVFVYGPKPEDTEAQVYFNTLIKSAFGEEEDLQIAPRTEEAWDWLVLKADKSQVDVSFYTKPDDRIEMVTRQIETVFDGPMPTVKDWEEVLHPPRAANLQRPGPSNPGGAQAVILVDKPTISEIAALIDNGHYDLATKEDVETLLAASTDTEHEEEDRQKDDFQGVQDEPKKQHPDSESHQTVTRYICFDTYDIDGDGLDEDVIWWSIRELPGVILKAAHLTEMYPFRTPRRPFGGNSFIPVRGRWEGISQLELCEGLHDMIKMTYDQMIDSNTITNSPFFFYRASGGMQPEVIALNPGEGYPLADPKNDVFFPQFNNSAATSGLNVIGLLNNAEERLTMQGDMQLGRVPPGRSSALRTVTGMAMLQNQGEARPERILRRFFVGLRDVYKMMHELNLVYLPENKKIRLAKTLDSKVDPYMTVRGPDDVRGNFIFDFDANVFNTSRQALQEGLMNLAQMYISPLNLQLGIISPDGVYRLERDIGKAFGQEPDQYLSPPNPESMMPRIMADEAILTMINGNEPVGIPGEVGGSVEHVQRLMEFHGSDQFGHMPEQMLPIFATYVDKITARAQAEQEQAAIMQAAQQQQGGQGGGPTGAPPQGGQENPNDSPTNVQPGQPADQTVPAGGNGSGAPQ